MPKLGMGTGSRVLMCHGGPPLCRGPHDSANDSLELKLRPVMPALRGYVLEEKAECTPYRCSEVFTRCRQRCRDRASWRHATSRPQRESSGIITAWWFCSDGVSRPGEGWAA